MLELNIKADLEEVSRYLNRLERREIPFATARALTWTAKEAQEANRRMMRRVFNAPTQRTIGSVRIAPAKKRNLTAHLWIKDEAPKGTPPIKYLAPQIYGGVRSHKRFERALQMRGILPSGWYAVPAEGAKKRNRYGNITGGMHQKILSAVGGSRDPRQDSRGRKAARFFVMYDNDKPLGIYERSGRRLRPWFWFTPRAPTYEARYHFERINQRVASKRWRRNFDKSLTRALRSINR